MADQNKPNFRSRQLGRTLRELREQAGMTQEELGKPLRYDKAKVSRIEQGHLPDYNNFIAVLDRLGVIASDYEEYVRAYDRAKEKGWWHAYGAENFGFVEIEADASAIRTYEVGFIPGLFQTERYMRAVFACDLTPATGKRLENKVAVRLGRQRRLIDEPVLKVHAIIDESALRRPPCDREQLTRIIDISALPNVTVQVVPTRAGVHLGLYSDFIVASFPDSSEPELAYVEYGFGSIQIEKVEEVRNATLLFDHLAGIALDEANSIALIRQMMDEL